MAPGFVLTASARSAPPQRGHTLTSTPNTRRTVKVCTAISKGPGTVRHQHRQGHVQVQCRAQALNDRHHSASCPVPSAPLRVCHRCTVKCLGDHRQHRREHFGRDAKGSATPTSLYATGGNTSATSRAALRALPAIARYTPPARFPQGARSQAPSMSA